MTPNIIGACFDNDVGVSGVTSSVVVGRICSQSPR